MTPEEKQRIIKLAGRKPLAVCVKAKQGHIVGIPPKLRSFRDPLFNLMPGSVQIAVEIGTCQGWFAWRCMKFLPETAHLFCVDPFQDGPDGEGAYNLKCWKRNLREWFGKRVFLKRGESYYEANRWGNVPIDFLFIDGDHRMEAVALDLESWVPKVRPGGLIAGHDIDGPHGEAVKGALEMFARKAKIRQVHVGKVYSFTGTQVTPCWWFYKEA